MADAGEIVLAAGAPDHADVRAEGIRALSRYVTFRLEQCLERADPARPEFVDVQTTIRKYMGDNPDQTYQSAAVRGDRSYRINATMADAVAVEIGVYAGSFGSSGGRRLVDAVEDTTLQVDSEGGYELLLTPDPEPGMPNWLDTAGHPQGSLSLRWFRSNAPLPEAETQVVPFDQLHAIE